MSRKLYIIVLVVVWCFLPFASSFPGPIYSICMFSTPHSKLPTVFSILNPRPSTKCELYWFYLLLHLCLFYFHFFTSIHPCSSSSHICWHAAEMVAREDADWTDVFGWKHQIQYGKRKKIEISYSLHVPAKEWILNKMTIYNYFLMYHKLCTHTHTQTQKNLERRVECCRNRSHMQILLTAEMFGSLKKGWKGEGNDCFYKDILSASDRKARIAVPVIIHLR